MIQIRHEGRGRYGSLVYALSAPTCIGHRQRDSARITWSHLRNGLAVFNLRLFLQFGPWDTRALLDLSPFMCPVCFWGGTWGRLRVSPWDDGGNPEDLECPRCKTEV